MSKDIKAVKSSPIDKLVWLLIIIILCVAIWANYYFAQIATALKLAGWIVLACGLLGLALTTRLGKNLWGFAKDSRAELRKVNWPTRQETIQTTLMVAGIVILVALILWAVDSLLLWLVGHLTGQRG